MHARVHEEVKLLKQQFPDLRHGNQFDWVLIPRMVLPLGRFNKDIVAVLFRIPVGYPQTGPDNFFVDADLRLRSGMRPPSFICGQRSSSGFPPVSGIWGWVSWHPRTWRPSASVEQGDNLSGYVRSIKLYFRGEQSA